MSLLSQLYTFPWKGRSNCREEERKADCPSRVQYQYFTVVSTPIGVHLSRDRFTGNTPFLTEGSFFSEQIFKYFLIIYKEKYALFISLLLPTLLGNWQAKLRLKFQGGDTSLLVEGLRRHTYNAGGMGLIPGRGPRGNYWSQCDTTRCCAPRQKTPQPHVMQWRSHVLQLRPRATK